MDRALVAELVARLKRRMTLAVSVTGGQLYVTVDDQVIAGAVERYAVVWGAGYAMRGGFRRRSS